jgi:hypothetical protein
VLPRCLAIPWAGGVVRHDIDEVKCSKTADGTLLPPYPRESAAVSSLSFGFSSFANDSMKDAVVIVDRWSFDVHVEAIEVMLHQVCRHYCDEVSTFRRA